MQEGNDGKPMHWNDGIPPWVLGTVAVLGFGLLPCTSGPLILGYFFGWPWAVGGVTLCWLIFGLFNGMISIPWKRRADRKPAVEENNNDVS